MRMCGDDPSTAQNETGRVALNAAGNALVVGDGQGTSTTIRFTRDLFNVRSKPAVISVPRGDSDEVLLHEIVHGIRQMAGTMLCNSVPQQPGYDTMEEFMAILISNIYRSERNPKNFLRADHQGMVPLPQNLRDSNNFVQHARNRSHLIQLKAQHGRLYRRLQEVQADFNPTQLV